MTVQAVNTVFILPNDKRNAKFAEKSLQLTIGKVGITNRPDWKVVPPMGDVAKSLPFASEALAFVTDEHAAAYRFQVADRCSVCVCWWGACVCVCVFVCACHWNKPDTGQRACLDSCIASAASPSVRAAVPRGRSRRTPSQSLPPSSRPPCSRIWIGQINRD